MYSIPVSFLIELFGYEPDKILISLNSFSIANDYKDHYLGWFIYYPSYLLFHLVFIFVLFQKKKKIRNIIAIALIIFVSILVIGTLVAKFLDLMIVYKISYELFQNLFSLPFILLAIEGGKIIVSDIDQLFKNFKP